MNYARQSLVDTQLKFFHNNRAVLSEQEKLYVDNEKYFNDCLVDLDEAKKTIDIETFIFSEDMLGERVAQHLIAAAQRGVKVRLMIDGMGALLLNDKFRKSMEAVGVKIKIFHPAPWRFWQWGYAINVNEFFLTKLFKFIAKSNVRNHRKVILIDKKIAWVGSLNITREHLSIASGGEGWCDAALRLKDIDFSDLELAFNAEWEGKHFKALFHESTQNRHIRLNNTLVRRMHLERNLYKKIRRSQKKVWITNAYFVPTYLLMRALQQAAWYEVDVRIILPAINNHKFMSLAGAMFYEQLIKSGIKIYLYQPTMIHEKSMVIDDWATVGSSNLNHRSLFSDYEVDIVLSTVEARVDLENHFLDNLALSKLVTLEYLRERPWWKRFLGRVLLIGRYFL